MKEMRKRNGLGVFLWAIVLILATLSASAPKAESQAVSLTDLRVVANQESGKIPPDQGKGATLFINKTDRGAPLRIGAKEYVSGLYCIHGSQSWSYDLGGDYTSLVMDLGLQEGTTFVRILGDDKQIYDSGVLPVKNHITPLIDVRGVKKLQIAVADNAVMGWNDKVVFGDPVLLRRPLPDASDVPGKAGAPPPIAKISASPERGHAPLEVKFTGDESKAPGGQVGRYTWTFGDGATETLSPNPTHTFNDPGIYEVLLQAEDDKGGIGIARQIVTVLPTENQPPIARAKASPRLVKIGESVQFDASDSSNSDGPITDYQWNFGDGQSGQGEIATHAYAQAGRYSVVLTVSNRGEKLSKVPVSIKVLGSTDAPVFPLQKGARVLLIGNSLIGFCGPIDAWLMTFDKVSPAPLGLVCQSRGKGLGKLVEYATWSRLGVHEKIDEGWDVVIIQPWLDALDPNVSDDQLLHDCKTLVDWAREAGAFPVIYEPQFGWQNLERDQALGHQRIMMLAEKLDTGFIPGGQAWLQVAKDYPMKLPGEGRGKKETDPDTLDGMMYSDFGHQSFTGALLNSLMIWKYLTGEELTELKLSATQPEVPQQAKKMVMWDRLGYLEKLADQSIVPAAQKIR
jgi:PKD repeat protein